MSIAAGASRFSASHAVTSVGVLGDVAAVGGSEEAWPSRAGIELRVGAKEQRSATNAVVGSVIVLIPVLSGKGALGATAAGYLILLGSKLLLPLRVGFGDPVGEFFWHRFYSPRNSLSNGRESCKVLEDTCHFEKLAWS
jgi:hypothetical protein